MPKVTKKTEGKGDAMVNTETGEETEMADDPLRPVFAPLGVQEMSGKKCEYRKVNVPQHRFTPLKEHWLALYEPVTKQMKIDMRMNLKTKKVELKTTQATEDEGALQKSADFIQAFLLGFEVQDAVALLRSGQMPSVSPAPRAARLGDGRWEELQQAQELMMAQEQQQELLLEA